MLWLRGNSFVDVLALVCSFFSTQNLTHWNLQAHHRSFDEPRQEFWPRHCGRNLLEALDLYCSPCSRALAATMVYSVLRVPMPEKSEGTKRVNNHLGLQVEP